MADTPNLQPSGLRGRLLTDEPMARHVSWRAGGRARQAYVPSDLADLCAFLRALPAAEPVLFAGLGSNLLVRDGGYRGTVVLMHTSNGAMRIEDGALFAEAGVAAPKVARFAAKQGMEGAEFLAGVPGTVGGALAMNAGCYGSETWEFVERVQVVKRDGSLHERTPSDYETGYRHVALRTPSEEWFTAGWFCFRGGDGTRSRDRIRELLARRIASQPLNLPNAGSVFRNPVGDHAARLIEACGLKGHRIGGACVSEKHANFIVNPDGLASAADIEALVEHVRMKVLREQHVALVPEVRIVGERK